MKQVTEKHFYTKMKSFGNFTISKIQVNPFACTSEKGDYMIQSKELDIIVECKEVIMTQRKSDPRFSLNRFTQEYKMIMWEESWDRNKGFLLLNYWRLNRNRSSVFLIPVKVWIERKNKIKRSFIKVEEALELFGDCKLRPSWDDIEMRLLK